MLAVREVMGVCHPPSEEDSQHAVEVLISDSGFTPVHWNADELMVIFNNINTVEVSLTTSLGKTGKPKAMLKMLPTAI